uniref:Uncharacterized protein n=1 Tax=Tanacetum cinerariifolium TaxID=118510 RepID=A0A699IKG3_TANCI|nr:hypothetical protein [Tanacetum cinerariifolium]
MSSITAQQTKLDIKLVSKENRLDIRICNGRIPRRLTPREPTFQIVLDAIALTLCYPAFLITVDVPEVYMHQDIFQIFPRVPGRDFDALPSKENTVSFLRELDHTGEIILLNDVVVDQMHQPWRIFAALINRSLSGKTSGLDKLRLSRAQTLLGMYYQKNVDYVELLWEDFIYQIENRVYKKQEKINKIEMHTSKDDYLISTLRFVFAKESTQIYGAILPECLTNPAMKESKAYKTYLGYTAGVVPPKIAIKFKITSPSKKATDLPAIGIVIIEPPMETKYKRKEKVDVTHGKGIQLLSKVALTEEAQMKEVRKKSLRDFHKLQPSGSGTASEKPPRVDKIRPPVTSEGTGDKQGVLDVTKDESTESESDKKGSDSEQDTDGSESDSKFDQQDNDDDDDDDDDDKSKGDDNRGMDSDDVQYKKAGVEMTDAQQKKENLKITQEKVVKDAHVTIMTVAKEFKVSDASVSLSFDLASKFLNFSYIHPNDVEIVSPLDVHVDHEVPRIHTSTLLTVLVSTTPTPPPTIETTNIPSLIKKGSSTHSDRGLKKRKTSKDSEPTTSLKNKDSTSRSSKGTKSQPKSSGKFVHLEEPDFEVRDTDTPQGQEKNQVTHVSLMRKHRYVYLEEIVVRRADNVLYKFKEGDFLQLRINDIEDTLLLVVHNWLTNLSGYDVADIAIALRISTSPSLILQDQISEKDTLTLHTKTPKDSFMLMTQRNRLMHSDELYKFSDGTLTRLLSSLEDITKNIHGVLAEEKMEQIRKEKRSFYDQGHQQAAKGKEDNEEFGEICWW